MIFRKNKLIILSILLIITASIISYSFYTHPREQKSGLDMDCSAIYSKRDKATGFYAQLNLFLHFNKNNTGYIDISGKAFNENKSYVAARAYNFSIHSQPGSIYHVTKITMSKRAADNMPDPVMDKLIFSIDSKDERYVKITKMDDAYVMSNLYSPAFICVVTDERAPGKKS